MLLAHGGAKQTSATWPASTILAAGVVTGLISPIGTWWVLSLLAMLLWALGRKRSGAWLAGAGSVWLFVWSTPLASHWLCAQLEAPYPALELRAIPPAEAAVVLGGAVRAASAGRPFVDLSASTDRVWHAARLYHAGKAPLLVLSGGDDRATSEMSEAHAMGKFLAELGVPTQALLLEENSRNTAENAAFSARLLQQKGIQRVLLITSAMHMPRALAHFQAQGLEFVPVAIDQTGPMSQRGVLAWLPDAGALERSSRAMKEYVGGWVMRWRWQR